MILALDLGLKTGVAIRSGKGIRSATLYLKKNGKTFEQQLVYFYKFLHDFYQASLIDKDPMEIVFEMPHGGYFASTRILFSMIGCIYLFSGQTGVKTYEVSPKTVKKFNTGNGNCSKEDMIEAMEKKFNRKMSSDNEADALGILLHHISKDA